MNHRQQDVRWMRAVVKNGVRGGDNAAVVAERFAGEPWQDHAALGNCEANQPKTGLAKEMAGV